MTKLWDDLKKNMKDWGSVAVEKAEEVSKIAVAKTEELTKISKIKIEIHHLQRDLAKTYENLGRLVAYHAKEENMVNFTGNKEFYRSLQKIEQTQGKITDKEGEIQKVKDEFNLQENDVSAAEQDTKTEVVEEETITSEDESHGKSSDPDTPKS